jgi:hypothetical protein
MLDALDSSTQALTGSSSAAHNSPQGGDGSSIDTLNFRHRRACASIELDAIDQLDRSIHGAAVIPLGKALEGAQSVSDAAAVARFAILPPCRHALAPCDAQSVICVYT